MPRIKKYENRIPAFYRRQALDIMLFTHVTALREFTIVDGNYTITIADAIDNFMEVYCISDNEFPIESALTTYNRVQQNFLYSELKRNTNN